MSYKPKELQTRPLYINEEQSLILQKLLEKQYHSNQQEFSHDDIAWLFAKLINKSCQFSGTLEQGETAKSIYKSLM